MKRIPPDQGDVVWINLNPTKGHEQKGHRPVLVLTPKEYNVKSGLMIISPITTLQKGYPFEVKVKSYKKKIKGVILSDQLRTLDWNARNIKKIDHISKDSLDKVLENIKLLLKL